MSGAPFYPEEAADRSRVDSARAAVVLLSTVKEGARERWRVLLYVCSGCDRAFLEVLTLNMVDLAVVRWRAPRHHPEDLEPSEEPLSAARIEAMLRRGAPIRQGAWANQLLVWPLSAPAERATQPFETVCDCRRRTLPSALVYGDLEAEHPRRVFHAARVS